MSELKILKINDDTYHFYHGKDYVGGVEYTLGQFFFGGGSLGCNESLMMKIVIIMRELDGMKRGVKEYLITEGKLRELRKKGRRSGKHKKAK